MITQFPEVTITVERNTPRLFSIGGVKMVYNYPKYPKKLKEISRDNLTASQYIDIHFNEIKSKKLKINILIYQM